MTGVAASSPSGPVGGREDHVLVFDGATWADFQRLLALRGERSSPRLSYCRGRLQIMSSSRSHEALKGTIGRLVEQWCLHRGVEFSTYGSWTLEDEAADCGLEPDECYVFGRVAEPERPDLAIEVVWTSGGVGKLEIYRALRVREVWFWRRGRLTAHVLRDEDYVEVGASGVLPGIDLQQLAQCLDRPTTSEAIRDYAAALGESR